MRNLLLLSILFSAPLMSAEEQSTYGHSILALHSNGGDLLVHISPEWDNDQGCTGGDYAKDYYVLESGTTDFKSLFSEIALAYASDSDVSLTVDGCSNEWSSYQVPALVDLDVEAP